MVKLYAKFQTFLATRKRSKGQSLAEYGLILALIAVICIAALQALGGKITEVLKHITDSLDVALG